MRWVIITITKNIRIHYSFFIILFFSIVTGLYLEFFIVFLSFLLHELGHLFFIKLFNYEVKKVTIFPFGGVIDYKFKSDFLYRYFLISIGGIIVNLIIYMVSFFLNFTLIKEVNLLFVLINLIPIFPLDGAKILLFGMKIIFPYYYAKKFIYVFSILSSLVIFIILYFKFSALILFVFLCLFIKENIFGYKNFKIEYSQFLLSRSMYKNPSLKKKKILKFTNPLNSLFYGYNMIFDFGSFELDEEEMFKKYTKKERL